jgi:hypothetical protein
MSAVAASGRFPGVTWEEGPRVAVTTLDALIRAHGTPRFIKVDVEGYESEVLQGLSVCVPYLSFEFTPECRDLAFECVDYLTALGMDRFNYSTGETLSWASDAWMSAMRVKDTLEAFGQSNVEFGDVYAAASCSPVATGRESRS